MIGEADRSGLVQVVEHLAVQAVAVDRDRGKEALLIHQRADDARHVILGRLEGQENRRLVGVGKTGRLGGQRPEQVDHAARQSADCGERDLPARADIGSAQGGLVGCLQGALGGQDEDGIGRNALGEQTAQAFHSDGRLAAAGRPGEEDFGVEGGLSNLALFFGQVHRTRVAESGGFVNR